MDTASSDPLQTLWDRLLSSEKDLVLLTYSALALDEQRAVLEHLKRMATEPGWQPEQRASALAALTALGIKPMG